MIVLTGALGFIGSHILKELNSRGINDVLLVDKHEDLKNKFKNIDGCRYADFLTPEQFGSKSFGFIKGIIHQGALTNTLCDAPTQVIQDNLDFSRALLNRAFGDHVKMIYASSAAVYGNSRDSSENLDNEQPLNLYGFSKLAFDNVVRTRLEKEKKHPTIFGLRYFNVYGPGEKHKGDMASFISKKIIEAKKTRCIEYFAPTASRDFVFVKDVARVNVDLLLNGRVEQSGVYNLGTGKSTKIIDVVHAIVDGFHEDNPNREIDVKEVGMPVLLEGRYQQFTKADLEISRMIFDPSKFTGLNVGIRECIDAY